jgi:predicted transcriptional regulator
MKGPEFTPQEQTLINSLMRSLDATSPIYLDILEKRLADIINEAESRVLIATTKALDALKHIHWKVASFRFDTEVDLILSDPEASTPTSRSLSLMKTKRTKQEVANKILSTLKQSDLPLSRSEIANRTGLRISTVCGSVKPLLDEGKIKVTGTKFDKDSQRQVETLGAKDE